MSWITGRHAIIAAIGRNARGTLYVVEKDPRATDIRKTALRSNTPVRSVSADRLKTLAGSGARGFAFELDETPGTATIRTLDDYLENTRDRESAGPIVALDHVTDPHNLGAILRSCWWFGADLVLLPARRSAPITDVVHRSSAGAASLVPIAHVSNLRNALDRCREAGWWIYAADAGGGDLSEADIDRRAVLVFGAEGSGVSPLIARTADAALSIPRGGGTDSVDSLNVSVSAGVILYEYRRRYPGG